MKQRLTYESAHTLLAGDPEELRAQAHAKRCEYLPGEKATYIIMRIVSYTNICVADCSYCAFYRKPSDPEGYVLSNEAIFKKIDDLLEVGGSLVAMEGGFHPKLKIDHYENLFQAVRERYGNKIEIYGPTIVEVIFIARSSRISLEEALLRLQKAGLHWIPGGGAEILTDPWRQKLSPRKYSVQEYLEGMELAQKLGFGTTATMVIGFGESWEDRIEHLEHVRQLQDKTGGFRSFLLWTYQSDNTALGGKRISNDEYLKALALSRLYLDNIPVIRASFLTQGKEGPLALKWGASDFDIALEDQVTQLAGGPLEANVKSVLEWVKKAEIEPLQRQPFFHPLQALV
ncbi:MAG: CofH family radical SAM protein [Chthoniobacterales bacterium]|nr:CofH family radical SAM protein [Chthoniobacterales bacterium]